MKMTDGKAKLHVSLEAEVTEEDVVDLMVTAIEGGIGYWACLDNSSETYVNADACKSDAEVAADILLAGGNVTFLDDDDRNTFWTLNLSMLLSGIRDFLATPYGHECIRFEGSRVSIDFGMVDADRADQIIQYAMFGNLIFG